MKQGEKYVESRVAERHRDHALFIAYAPADKPRIALAVLAENGGHGGAPPHRSRARCWTITCSAKCPTSRHKDEQDTMHPISPAFHALHDRAISTASAARRICC